MTTFGDYTDDDAYDTEPADPEQVARFLHRIRFQQRLEDRRWDQLSTSEAAQRVALVERVLAFLRRQGAS